MITIIDGIFFYLSKKHQMMRSCFFYLAGPGVGGNYGPYRQSERNALYKQFAEKLLQSGHVYRCFCSAEVIVLNFDFVFSEFCSENFESRYLYI